MAATKYLGDRLRAEMVVGNMHACLRDVGRLAGGLAASGELSVNELAELSGLANELAINKREAATKWQEAVEHGRGEPVEWNRVSRPDRVFDWNDEIGDDYQIVDPNWVEPIETTEPADWDPVAEVSAYLSALFSSEDHVGYVTEAWQKDDRQIPTRGVYSRTAGELLKELARYKEVGAVFGDVQPDVGAWVRFNPLDGEGVRDANVTDFRFALVESDKMTIEQQRGIYEQLELPIAAMVHSGNKSLHAIVRIEADTLVEYKRRVDLLYDVCAKNGLEVDRQNRNPSRLSRLPGVMRGDKRQYLVATNIGKPSWTAWEEWIEAVNDDMPDPECMADEWDRMPPLADPLIDGILRQGHKMLISGSSKAGKSFLLIQLCAAIAEGREWVGLPCAKGRVLYVNLELDRASCLHRFRDVYQALGWHPDNISNIDVWNLRGRAVPMDRLAPKLIRRAIKKRYVAVVIDPIYKVITGDENAADKMAHFCNQFDKVCHELNAAVIYCHHHSKGLQGGKRSMDRASGSGVFARDPDALLDLIELVVPADKRDGLLNKSAYFELDTSRWSAWRIEGTMREFAKPDPVDCWFAYPIHREATETLHELEPERDEAPWKRGLRNSKERAENKASTRGAKMAEAYQYLSSDGQVGVSVESLAQYFSTSERTIRNWIYKEPGWRLVNGHIEPVQAAAGTEPNHADNGDAF